MALEGLLQGLSVPVLRVPWPRVCEAALPGWSPFPQGTCQFLQNPVSRRSPSPWRCPCAARPRRLLLGPPRTRVRVTRERVTWLVQHAAVATAQCFCCTACEASWKSPVFLLPAPSVVP